MPNSAQEPSVYPKGLLTGGIDTGAGGMLRQKSVRIPLFTSKTFPYPNHEGILRTLSTRRVVRSLAVPDQERSWAYLHRLNGLLQSESPVLPEERLQPGELVEITSGPQKGYRGRVVVRPTQGKHFVVEVDCFPLRAVEISH